MYLADASRSELQHINVESCRDLLCASLRVLILNGITFARAAAAFTAPSWSLHLPCIACTQTSNFLLTAGSLFITA
jgi:hypothetical protein